MLCQLLRRAVLLSLGACVACSNADETSRPASDPPETDRLFWVDPARCLAPCSYLPRDHLVGVDENGAADAHSARRFAAHAQPKLMALIAAASADGRSVWSDSGFRTYEEQVEIHAEAIEIGRAARPGHSEHQIGTAMDFGFAGDADAEWLRAHAWEHGFVQSYPPGKQKLTGFRGESWHYRFVGDAAAAEIQAQGWSVQEYFRAYPERGVFGDCGDCAAPASRSDCAAVDAVGQCAGTVLRWCFDGALAEVDCALDGQLCATTDGEPRCIEAVR